MINLLGVCVTLHRALKESKDPVRFAQAVSRDQFKESAKCYPAKTKTN